VKINHIAKTATLSPCGRYRFTLSRVWNQGARRICWVMLNPSTADAQQDDPTIRRCVGFSVAWGYDALVVVNLFAFRNKDPKTLLTRPRSDIEHAQNDASIREAALASQAVVCAWGSNGHHFRERADAVRLLLQGTGLTPHHLGMTTQGQPQHPLYVPAARMALPMPWLQMGEVR
jgi:hypothetical protein